MPATATKSFDDRQQNFFVGLNFVMRISPLLPLQGNNFIRGASPMILG
jgi:hypothetical protein